LIISLQERKKSFAIEKRKRNEKTIV